MAREVPVGVKVGVCGHFGRGLVLSDRLQPKTQDMQQEVKRNRAPKLGSKKGWKLRQEVYGRWRHDR